MNQPITCNLLHELQHPQQRVIERFKVLRPILFFAREQIVSQTKLKEYFTNHAIKKMIVDKYLKPL